MMSLQIGKHSRREEDRLAGLEVVAGNDDLLTLILLHLPVKSLLRFKSVSKHWLSLISDPQFRILKSKRCCKHTSGIILKLIALNDPKIEFVLLESRPAPVGRLHFGRGTWSDVLQHCNGLLLIQTTSHSFTETKYSVINPTTRQHAAISIPVEEFISKGLEVYFLGLAFDPRKSPYFKVICLFWKALTAAHYCVLIYSSETGLTTQLSDHFPTSYDIVSSRGTYWNGAINWIDYGSDGLYFNVDEERFGILPMPPVSQFEYNREIRYYGESNDHLYLVYTDTDLATQIDVYEMDREYSGWFVRFHVDLRPMLRAFPAKSKSLHKDFCILTIVDKDDGENSIIVFGRLGKAIRFHLKHRALTKIYDFSGVDDAGFSKLFYWFWSFQFVESLHPL